MSDKRYFVFDVESIGLYGEGFAAAFVVVDATGKELDNGYMACDALLAEGADTDRAWVTEHVLPALPEAIDCIDPECVRACFWSHLAFWKTRGALIFADCAAPVEAKFLAARFQDAGPPSPYDGPYPLHDVATVLLCAGMDPLETYARLPNELPAHNPLNDARQSARLLVNALRSIGWAITAYEGENNGH